MKNILIILTLTILGLNSFAQDNEFAKMMREMYKDEFIDIMNENMNLSESQNAVFQPIFSSFMGELGNIMDKKLNSQKKFAEYFDGMTNEQATTIMKEIFANSKAYDKLLGSYTKKVSKAIDPQTAFRFYMIVEKVKSTIDYPTIQNIPLVKN